VLATPSFTDPSGDSGDASLAECISAAELRLEPIAGRHQRDVARLAAHPEVAATSNLPHPYPADAARLFITASTAAFRAGRRRTYAIMAPLLDPEQEAEVFTGVCMLSLHESGTMAQVGYWIGRPYWGRGLATHAVERLLQLSRRDLPKVQLFRAHCLAENPASSRVLEKNGFLFDHSKLKLYPKWRRPRETRFYQFRVTSGGI
jgi:RimJ/RimL family protein N-acetyltransferase